MRKRTLDLVLAGLTAPLWVPLMGVMWLAILLSDGRPALYVSSRRVDRTRTIPLIKFRTMIKDAEKVANRDTIKIENVCFLNIALDSPLYTRLGRLLERYHLNELPQIIHVLTGHMSIVGSRPLPENVIKALQFRYPHTEDRFLTKTALVGPIQLVGRDALSDEDRLQLETEYSRLCLTAYSPSLDLKILLYTLLILSGLKRPLSVSEVRALMQKCGRHGEETAESDRIESRPSQTGTIR